MVANVLACNCGDNRLIEGFFINFMCIENRSLAVFSVKNRASEFQKGKITKFKTSVLPYYACTKYPTE